MAGRSNKDGHVCVRADPPGRVCHRARRWPFVLQQRRWKQCALLPGIQPLNRVIAADAQLQIDGVLAASAPISLSATYQTITATGTLWANSTASIATALTVAGALFAGPGGAITLRQTLPCVNDDSVTDWMSSKGLTMMGSNAQIGTFGGLQQLLFVTVRTF